MRLVPILLALAIATPASAADLTPNRPAATPAPHCPQIARYLANANGLYRGAPLAPRKLTELPPATGYMAVYRTINGCEAPLTVADYRRTERR